MKNTKGRPKKCSTEELKTIINLYIEKNKDKVTRLSPSKLALYATTELGKSMHYQDFTRNSEIKQYIDDFNTSLTRSLSRIPNAFEVPVYEKLDPAKFLEKNNTQEMLYKALVNLDITREKVHDSYGKLQDKYVAQVERTHKLEAEIQQLKKQLLVFNKEKHEEIKQLKRQVKTSDERNRTLRAKNKILETFLNEHFYETMASYCLYIEGLISSGVAIDNPDLIRADDYKCGNYDLSDVIKAYNEIASSINDDAVEHELPMEIAVSEERSDYLDENDSLSTTDELEQEIDSHGSSDMEENSLEKQLEKDIFGESD